jgi:hypothetical protein
MTTGETTSTPTPTASRQSSPYSVCMYYFPQISVVCVFNEANNFLVNLTPSNIIGFKTTLFCRLPFLLIYVQQVSLLAAVNCLTPLQVMINGENQHVQITITVSWLCTHSKFLASHIHLSSFILYPL